MAVSRGFGQYAERQKVLKAQYKAGVERVVSEAFKLYGRSVIRKTPVDTALAVSNWISSIGAPVNQVVIQPVFGDRGAGITKAEMLLKSIAKLYKIGRILFISNSVSYIEELDGGSSAQAPNGMTGPAEDNVRLFLKAVRIF